jgi:hypothetical protein
MRDIETLLEAARQHGLQSARDHEVGDLQDMLRYAWSQLPCSCRERMAVKFQPLVLEWCDRD